MFSKSMRSTLARLLFAAVMFAGVTSIAPPTTNGDCVTPIGDVCPTL